MDESRVVLGCESVRERLARAWVAQTGRWRPRLPQQLRVGSTSSVGVFVNSMARRWISCLLSLICLRLWPHLGPASAGRLGSGSSKRQKSSLLLKWVARAGRLLGTEVALLTLLPIISHAVKRFLTPLHPITCHILLDLTTR